MNRRRRKGATLGLVAVCVMVIVVVGVGVYFLAKILGGGREVANATDAGALNVAKTALAVNVPAPTEFKEFEYPGPGSGITLLTYNRCVAKVMIIAMNAKNVGGSAPGNVPALIGALTKLGDDLKNALIGNDKFNELSTANQHRMINQTQTITGAVTDSAYMKPKGATNIFFSSNVSSAGLNPPKAVSEKKPLNAAGVAQPDAFYMAGYTPITLATGQQIYGTPVFPQVTPHLVATGDFSAATGTAHGSAPPNSFKSGSSVIEQKTSLFTGAVACAIVGAINGGGSKGGSIGNGFEFPGALPYGYIEIQNMPANPEPPGYDAGKYDGNIFNNWLSEDTYVIGDAPGGKTQNSTYLLFGHSDDSVNAWLKFANGLGPQPPNVSQDSKNAVFFQFPGAAVPQQLSSATMGLVSKLKTGITYPRPGGDNLPQPANCYAMLSNPKDNYALVGPCVPGSSAITALSAQEFPQDPPPQSGQNFSNVDQVKAQVLVAFANQGTAPGKPWQVQVSPIQNTGLGVYADLYGSAEPYPLPSPAPLMPVPTSFKMPLQRVGSVWDLLHQVGGCSVTTTLDDIVLRCQEIQPKTTRGEVIALLKATQLPMSPAHSASNYKLNIYLPGGNLASSLVCDTGNPPGMTGTPPPDGVNPMSTSFPGPACQYNKYYIQDRIVNTRAESAADFGDELVHQAPYLEDDPPAGPGGMYAYDWAHWWPGSGANNNLGRLWFENGAYGGVHFSHIN